MRSEIGTVLMMTGAVLLAAALTLYAYNRVENWRAGNEVSRIEEELETALEDSSILSTDEATEETVAELDGNTYIGTLSIDRFGLELPIMASWSYANLKLAPCRYSGRVVTDDLVICGHNYERHFGKLSGLEAGDLVTFTTVTGYLYTYEVTEVITIEPTAVDELLSGDWDLSLFTCTYGGQARVVVRLSQVEAD